MADESKIEPHRTRRVDVWDSRGIRSSVRPVDAKEIVEAGGSLTDPKEKEKNECK